MPRAVSLDRRTQHEPRDHEHSRAMRWWDCGAPLAPLWSAQKRAMGSDSAAE